MNPVLIFLQLFFLSLLVNRSPDVVVQIKSENVVFDFRILDKIKESVSSVSGVSFFFIVKKFNSEHEPEYYLTHTSLGSVVCKTKGCIRKKLKGITTPYVFRFQVQYINKKYKLYMILYKDGKVIKKGVTYSRKIDYDQVKSFVADEVKILKFADYEVYGLKFKFIKGGCFYKGCLFASEKECIEAGFKKKVCLEDFYVSKLPVSVGQFKECVKDKACHVTNFGTFSENEKCNYGKNKDFSLPMNCVNFIGAKEFAKWFSKKTGRIYQVPTESEWEFSAKNSKGGKILPWAKIFEHELLFSDSNLKPQEFDEERYYSIYKYKKLDSLWEWCSDIVEPQENSGYSTSNYRVLRGGDWFFVSWYFDESVPFWKMKPLQKIDIIFRVVQKL